MIFILFYVEGCIFSGPVFIFIEGIYLFIQMLATIPMIVSCLKTAFR